MCRLAAYIGAAAPLSELMFDAPHALERQAYAPREMLRGNVNVDGTGLAWWRSPTDEPRGYAIARPPWADPNLRGLTTTTAAAIQLMSVRSATPGMGHSDLEVAPFLHDGIGFAHNGWIDGFHGALGQDLVGALPAELFSELRVLNDSRVFFLTLLKQCRAGADLPEALHAAYVEVANACRRFGRTAMLNVVASDGARLVALRASVDERVNSLYLACGTDGVYVASEPLGEVLDWAPCAEGELIEVSPAGEVRRRSVV